MTCHMIPRRPPTALMAACIVQTLPSCTQQTAGQAPQTSRPALFRDAAQPISKRVNDLLSQLIEPYVDAIILAWYPGEQGGNALADLLFGKISPSDLRSIT